MTEREELELTALAALAVGLETRWINDVLCVPNEYCHPNKRRASDWTIWNPRYDDGI